MVSNTKVGTEKDIWVECLRIFAAIAVITVHVTASNMGNYPVDSWTWRITNIYSSSVRWCVPIFLMITGMFVYARPKKKSGI